MRRETAERVSLTIDRDLLAWFNQYCYANHITKSQLIEYIISVMCIKENKDADQKV